MIIVVAAKIIFDAFYEVAGDPNSTNWTVAYHAINYTLIASVLMYTSQNIKSLKFLKHHRHFVRWLSNILGMLYNSYAMIELTYINTPFDEYSKAMTEGYFGLNYAGIVALSVAAYSAMYLIKKKLNLQWA